MKIRALVHGSDGTREYKAGDELGDSQHARVLLFNNLADPLDEHAQRLHQEMLELSDEDWAAHPLASEAHWDRGEEARAVVADAETEADVTTKTAPKTAPPPRRV
jgi:hypothetical protein